MDDSIVTAEAIAQIRALGVELSVDDFGTGYSLPLYLRRFPVTSLKIDRSFIASLVAHAEDTSIVTGVIGRTVVAEGVEGVATPQQPQLPQDLGCSFAQGWLWSPALRAHELPVGSGTDIGAVPSSVLRSRSHAPARRGLPLRAADLARTGSLLHRDDSKATRARR
jgi:EAL domain-containing protein (putative c-di-GMP-specific phosphodiesterase class I)